eukprot:2707986-Alexandrium_andersonii.AAC.1
MSASLVGSEMCIRDSFKGLSRHRGSALAFGAVPVPSRLFRLMLPYMLSCLLYTSDAADDM